MEDTAINKELQDLQLLIEQKYPGIRLFECMPADILFEESVLLSCFYCSRYSRNWRCPPNIPSHIDFKAIFQECKSGFLVLFELPFNDANYQEIRSETSVRLHKAILELEKILWRKGIAKVLSFIGGSCKLCKNGCSKDKCVNPGESRVPLEAVGVNVVKSAEKVGIKVVFPPQDTLKRIGLVIW